MSTVAETADTCKICKTLLSNAHEFEDESPDIRLEFILGSNDFDIKRIHLTYQGPASGDDGFVTGLNIVLCRYMVYALPSDPAAQFVQNRPMEVAVGSLDSTNAAKSWLSQCCADHEDCNQTGTRFMPTRCLKVSDLNAIHLCNTKEQDYSYAALSYCWGPKQYPNLITTQESLKEMLVNIPLESFPLTLRDGIVLAHELGLPFLWIDALCIIQDDDDDKDSEIPQIRRIFSQAHCTIIAATAAHCHSGFLHTRELPPFSEFCAPYPVPDVNKGLITLRKYNPDKWTLYDPFEDPINERAWTLEERLLSPRRLIYSKNHLRWLCETSELTHGGDPEDRKWPSGSGKAQTERLPFNFSSRTTPDTNGPAEYLQKDVWRSWLTIIREYNLRYLTKSKDKLRAIGGIADLYHLRTNDQYCAGLWRSHLAEELLWNMFHPRATLSSMLAEARDYSSTSTPTVTLFPRPKYRAPTWSWASVDGFAANNRALVPAPFVADVFEVIDCVVEPEKPNASLTTVRSAVLTVRGRVKKALLHVESQLLYEKKEAYETGDDFGRCDLDALEHEQYPDLRSVHCLEITSRVRKGFCGNQQGIAIVKVPDTEMYKRIGRFGTFSLHENPFEGIEPCFWNLV